MCYLYRLIVTEDTLCGHDILGNCVVVLLYASIVMATSLNIHVSPLENYDSLLFTFMLLRLSPLKL
jgi:hypothetical protein